MVDLWPVPDNEARDQWMGVILVRVGIRYTWDPYLYCARARALVKGPIIYFYSTMFSFIVFLAFVFFTSLTQSWLWLEVVQNDNRRPSTNTTREKPISVVILYFFQKVKVSFFIVTGCLTPTESLQRIYLGPPGVDTRTSSDQFFHVTIKSLFLWLISRSFLIATLLTISDWVKLKGT